MEEELSGDRAGKGGVREGGVEREGRGWVGGGARNDRLVWET